MEKNREVFIFGSNSQGFHGAGAAGEAFRGNSDFNWRTCPIVKDAISHGPGYVGKMAVWGCSRGYQEGTEGSSYAVQTVDKPGQAQSAPLGDIAEQVVALCKFIRDNPDKEFILTPFGSGLAGYHPEDMLPLWLCVTAYPNVKWSTKTNSRIIALTNNH